MAETSGRTWEELIAEGRRLDTREGELRFAWGDWALKVAPMGKDGVNNGATEVLQRAIAEAQISVSPEMMGEYRQVAAAWAPSARAQGAAWATHRVLSRHPDRHSLIKSGMTSREAERLIGRKTSSGTGRTPDERAEKVREYLKDPETLKVIAADPQSSSALHLASAKVGAEIRNENDRRREREEPQTVETEKFYKACSQLHGAAHRVRVALSLLRDVTLDDDSREMVRADINQITTGIDWLTSYVDSGNRSFDAELAELLRQGAE